MNNEKAELVSSRAPLFLRFFIRPEIFRELNHPDFPSMKVMVDAPAVRERNVLIPFASDQLLRLFLGFQVDKPPDVMIFIEKVSDFKFFHENHPLS